MKILLYRFCLVVAAVSIFSACSMDKRVYRKGWHVEWFASKKPVKVKENNSSIANITHATIPFKQNITIAKQEFHESSSENIFAENRITGSGLRASVPHQKVVNLASDKPITTAFQFRTKSGLIAAAPYKKMMAKSDGDSQIIAFILCLLIGIFGAHRFYLGYYGIGVAQLLTLGGCGIWALVDLIMILTGDLQPKDGSYTETF